MLDDRCLPVLAMVAAFTLQGLVHEGHDHKVLGTVTMAAADHVASLQAGRSSEPFGA
jgi:hypothetical protein